VKTKLAAVSTVLTFACIATIGACSSSSNTATTTTDSGTTLGDGASGPDTGVINDPQNCVPPGTVGNALGIGGYCSPLAGQCDTAGPGGAARICTGDLTSTPAHAWFCTYPCSHTRDCGEGNVCFENSEGAGCIPTSCLYLDSDSGMIVPDDAGASDAAGD
jgi:hypothetical protein